MDMAFPSVQLDDKYTATTGRIYLSGVQALVRLMLVQRRRDAAAGLNTAGFVSGYRGSPLGGLDEALWRAQPHLEAHAVKFLPGVNEELAATAVWGTQQLHLTGGSRHDGVFAMWYGKAPGVDRCGDVFKHMSHAGTAAHGGVLLVAGDDHGAYSSTLPNQSDHLFAASMIPFLYPDGVDEYLELGLHGFALSRYCGLPVGFKALADTVESSTSIAADHDGITTRLPADVVLPADGVHARLSSETLGQQARTQEALMQDHKIYAAIAYARANRLNRVTHGARAARLGIAASGKSWRDVLEALRMLDIGAQQIEAIGLRIFKIAMPWPLEPESSRAFAHGLEEILVVEEKRQIVEYQLKEHVYNWREDVRPRIVGKFDEAGEWARPRPSWLLPAKGDLSVAQIARVIARRIARFHHSDTMARQLALLDACESALAGTATVPPRPAWYCSGCPHNTSTRVPDGSLALAGIGCHVMATAIYPQHNRLTTHMGGEGAPWLGQAWFSNRNHVFANLGDGTYFHSGSMAIRAAIAAGVNITYKILYNDAVAMTGGQPVDGPLTVPRIVHQLAAEGVRRIALVSETPEHWSERTLFPPDGPDFRFTLQHRDAMDAAQRALRAVPGVSVLIYDQVCAAEKRRRRRKGELPQAPQRVFINEAVCEGCGDCGAASNCTSLLPQPTAYGLKRRIDQSSCNVDLSCVKGFCPSFVTVQGVQVRKPVAAMGARAPAPGDLPSPDMPAGTPGHDILITGIGGTGVITIGALIGMAAHLEGKPVSVLDMTGMSQKNGAVTSHVRIGAAGAPLHAQRIPVGGADLVLACDMLTAGAPDVAARMRSGHTCAVVNTLEQPTGHFAQQPDWQFPAQSLRAQITAQVGARRAFFVDATELATRLLGDAITSNLFLLGFAFQKGQVPVSEQALLQAITINGVAVAMNRAAFQWGRQAALDLPAVTRAAAPEQPVQLQRRPTLRQLIDDRVATLRVYQNAAYADDYRRLVAQVQEMERRHGGSGRLARAVATNLFKLMAIKDEYEVARLYTDGSFRARLAETFEGTPRVRYHFAPPLFSRRDANGVPVKQSFGPWLGPALRLLAGLRGIRGTVLDPFCHTQERRQERALLREYRQWLTQLLARFADADAEVAWQLACLPEQIRGFGHVKQEAMDAARVRRDALLARLYRPPVEADADAALHVA